MKYICDIVARYAYISKQPENRSRTCENKTYILQLHPRILYFLLQNANFTHINYLTGVL